MITTLFFVLLAIVFGRLCVFAFRAAWSTAKVVLWLIALPFTLIWLVLKGLLSLAFPVLAVIGLISLLTDRR